MSVFAFETAAAGVDFWKFGLNGGPSVLSNRTAGGFVATRGGTTANTDLLVITATGVGLVYDAAGVPISGTITGLTIRFRDAVFASIQSGPIRIDDQTVTLTGLSLSAADFDHLVSSQILATLASGADLIKGGSGADVIGAGLGNDTVFAGGGTDTVYGDGGDDQIDGGDGNDELHGEMGNDTVLGSGGADFIAGGDGSDFLNGQTGDDIIDGGDGQDTLSGELGNDQLLGGGANDTLFGGDGNDFLNGQTGDDYLEGGSGQDTLSGELGSDGLYSGAGNDLIFGGDGNDYIEAGDGDDTMDGGAGNDALYGGNGIDTLSYAEATAGVFVDMRFAGHYAFGTTTGFDVFASAERIVGSSFADFLFGSASEDSMSGGGGIDVLFGFDGNDSLDGGAGTDYIVGGCGADVITTGAGQDYIYFFDQGEGRDIVTDWRANGFDLIVIDEPSFGGGLTAGQYLSQQAGRFVTGTAATANVSQFIWNGTTSTLSWDQDGTGAMAAVDLVKLTGVSVLTANDILIL
jgi:Ca2+-binding RTX toxin-like protein